LETGTVWADRRYFVLEEKDKYRWPEDGRLRDLTEQHWDQNLNPQYTCPLLENAQDNTRCGPHYSHRKCGGGGDLPEPAWALYCNEDNGWCGDTVAHKNAQASNTYDFVYPTTPTRCKNVQPKGKNWVRWETGSFFLFQDQVGAEEYHAVGSVVTLTRTGKAKEFTVMSGNVDEKVQMLQVCCPISLWIS
jgi:hypothetical protein